MILWKKITETKRKEMKTKKKDYLKNEMITLHKKESKKKIFKFEHKSLSRNVYIHS